MLSRHIFIIITNTNIFVWLTTLRSTVFKKGQAPETLLDLIFFAMHPGMGGIFVRNLCSVLTTPGTGV